MSGEGGKKGGIGARGGWIRFHSGQTSEICKS